MQRKDVDWFWCFFSHFILVEYLTGSYNFSKIWFSLCNWSLKKNAKNLSSFIETSIDVKGIATDIDVKPNFESTITLYSVRRGKTNFSYETQDEPRHRSKIKI